MSWWRDRDPELQREIRDHLDLETEDRQQAGASDHEARREARLAFGNPVSVSEDVRETWGWGWFERLAMDVRHALRLWLKSPAFSTIAILTIGIGIGASTAIVGQINAVFWKTLPVANPDALRLVAWTSPRTSFLWTPNVYSGPTIDGQETYGSFSYPAYRYMRERTQTFSDLACWADLGESRPVVLGELGFGAVQFVSGNYFRALGVTAALGRTLQPEDDDPRNWSAVAMISDRFWKRTFGGDPNVTRQSIQLNGRTFTIVGVMPESFFGMDPSVSPDVVVPNGAVVVAAATANPLMNPRLWNPCRVVGRLRTGVSDAEASAELTVLVKDAIGIEPPAEPYDPPQIKFADARRGLSTLRDAASAPLLVLLAVVVGLLLTTCANIAGLLVARGSARERELATRMALGASRWRVIRQLVTESVVLSIAGGIFGLCAAYAMSGMTTRLVSQFMPTLFGADRTLTVTSALDWRVMLAGGLLTLLAGMMFGSLPALRATRVDLMRVIRQSTGGAGRGRFRLTAGQSMVAIEAAIAMVLVIGAGAFLQTLTNLRSADLGLNPDGVLYARVEPRSGRMAPEGRQQFFEEAVKRLQSLPGVMSASASGLAPMGGDASVGLRFQATICVPGANSDPEPRTASVGSASPGYFVTLGIPLRSGREFGWQDNQQTRSVIVNEALRARYLHGQAGIGEPIRLGTDVACRGPLQDFTVVGIVADSRGPRTAAEPAIYFPLGGFGGPVTLMVRTSNDAASMIPTVRRAISELNASIPTFSEATLVDLRERQLRRERLLSGLLLLFGAATLLVCCLGIYGLLSYAVVRRRAEISLRMAIGARAQDIVRMIVRESIVPVAIGLSIGCVAAIALTRWIDSMLFGVSAADPWTLAAATAVLLLVALAAALLPARAAARVDPVLALRQ